MNCHSIRSGPMGNNTYIIGEKNSPCLVIDPSFGTKEILSYIQKNHGSVEKIILTHGHFDHMVSVNQLVEEYQCPVYIHSLDNDLCYDPIANFSHQAKQDVVIRTSVLPADDLSDVRFQVVHTPGHSMGSISLYFPEKKWLFSGDTLFNASVGRTDFPGGNEKELKYSLRKLFTLPEDVIVFPGHDEKTSIAAERLKQSR